MLEFVAAGPSRSAAVRAGHSTRLVAVRRRLTLSPHAGALCKLLKPFEDFKINLNRIESRPSNKGEYTFEMALDFNGDIRNDNVQVVCSAVFGAVACMP
jgi:prephenate dehydratase